jgi:4-alpha-glucanotransferase
MRRRVLEVLSEEFFASPKPNLRMAAFERFLRERPEVEDYARFRAVCDRTGASWHQWPKRLRNGRLRDGDCDEATRNFRAYTQWLAHGQVESLGDSCRESGTKLYLDLPLGVDGDSYDLWREQASFTLDASAGAPPDVFFSKGQNWGFAPLHPERIRERRYQYVLDYLRFQMRRAGVLRIDHVMGLHRLYWIPKNCSALEGAYVRYNADEYYALLSLESHRHRTALIGENLGIVPPEVNQSMRQHGLRTMFLVPFEQKPDPKAALPSPPRRCISGLNTHDMPTFAAHWRGLDILDHADLGLITGEEIRIKRAQRRALNAALVQFLKQEGFLRGAVSTERVLEAVLAWLASGPSELVLVNLEDLLGETNPQNTPGTTIERANWQNKARRTIERVVADKRIALVLRQIDRARAPS